MDCYHYSGKSTDQDGRRELGIQLQHVAIVRGHDVPVQRQQLHAVVADNVAGACTAPRAPRWLRPPRYLNMNARWASMNVMEQLFPPCRACLLPKNSVAGSAYSRRSGEGCNLAACAKTPWIQAV